MKLHLLLGYVLFPIFLGSALGIGGFTFFYGRGYSYLSNDPQACVNCHIMQPQYDGWNKSSHRHVATCNDCHTPAHWVGKYVTKASNGFWHSWAFTTQHFHEPIHIKPANLAISEAACLKCHSNMWSASNIPAHAHNRSCTHCHQGVGHER